MWVGGQREEQVLHAATFAVRELWARGRECLEEEENSMPARIRRREKKPKTGAMKHYLDPLWSKEVQVPDGLKQDVNSQGQARRPR